ncbi:MAG: thioredoxin [Haloquadratum sp. J07HQX50]|jgi:thioredoxin|nr:MAG: thioredoxin [Haloquadratum sp. J07HQX50]
MGETGSTDELSKIREKKRERLQSRLNKAGDETKSESVSPAPTEPLHITSESEFEKTISSYDIVLVDFYADWCGPCKMLEPTVESIAESTRAAVAKVDIDQHQQLAQQFQVRGVPTLLLFENGETVEQIVGVRDEPTLRSLIEQYV